MKPPSCPYCGSSAVKTHGKDIWPALPYLARKKVWRCIPCEAHVGTHGDTWKPLGTLANKETRNARTHTHAMFDPLWKTGKMTRSEAYKLLSSLMGISEKQCHIAMFNVQQCEAAQESLIGIEV
jgi:ribosomal protein L37AE/L43A